MAEAAPATLRLDLFLCYARLVRTRPLAQALAETGRLRLDSRRIERAHVPVRIGTVLTLFTGGRARVLRVDALPTRRGPAPEARACYIELGAAVDAPDEAA